MISHPVSIFFRIDFYPHAPRSPQQSPELLVSFTLERIHSDPLQNTFGDRFLHEGILIG